MVFNAVRCSRWCVLLLLGFRSLICHHSIVASSHNHLNIKMLLGFKFAQQMQPVHELPDPANGNLLGKCKKDPARYLMLMNRRNRVLERGHLFANMKQVVSISRTRLRPRLIYECVHAKFFKEGSQNLCQGKKTCPFCTRRAF